MSFCTHGYNSLSVYMLCCLYVCICYVVYMLCFFLHAQLRTCAHETTACLNVFTRAYMNQRRAYVLFTQWKVNAWRACSFFTHAYQFECASNKVTSLSLMQTKWSLWVCYKESDQFEFDANKVITLSLAQTKWSLWVWHKQSVRFEFVTNKIITLSLAQTKCPYHSVNCPLEKQV